MLSYPDIIRVTTILVAAHLILRTLPIVVEYRRRNPLHLGRALLFNHVWQIAFSYMLLLVVLIGDTVYTLGLGLRVVTIPRLFAVLFGERAIAALRARQTGRPA